VASAGLYASLHLIPDNHANIPPLSFLRAGCPSCRPTNSIKALKVISHPLSVSSIYYDPRHPPCSIYVPDNHFPQFFSLQVFFGQPVGLASSISYSIHFFTQPLCNRPVLQNDLASFIEWPCFFPLALNFSRIFFIIKMAPVLPLLFIKPNCISPVSICCRMLYSKILSTTFIVCSNNLIPL